MKLKTVLRWTLLWAIGGVASFADHQWWKLAHKSPVPEGIVYGNGRIESIQVDIAAKYGGRIKEVRAREGDLVESQVKIDDSTLKSPVKGRVLYRLAEPGEVVALGGKVLTLINLNDVSTEIFLPAQEAARVTIGADARIVLDVRPEYSAQAKASYVSPEAQFTPKQVETRSERDQLMFRVKLKILAEIVLPYIERIKTGSFPGNDHTDNGPIRPADHLADHRSPIAVRGEHARREPARLDAADHADPALATLCRLLSSHHLPRSRVGDRVASIPGRRWHWALAVCLQSEAIPSIDRS